MRAIDAPFPWQLFLALTVPYWLYLHYGWKMAVFCFVVVLSVAYYKCNKEHEEVYNEVYAKLSCPLHTAGWIGPGEYDIHHQIVKELGLRMAYGHSNVETGMQHYIVLR